MEISAKRSERLNYEPLYDIDLYTTRNIRTKQQKDYHNNNHQQTVKKDGQTYITQTSNQLIKSSV